MIIIYTYISSITFKKEIWILSGYEITFIILYYSIDKYKDNKNTFISEACSFAGV